MNEDAEQGPMSSDESVSQPTPSLEWVDPSEIKKDPNQKVDRLVETWIVEIRAGDRVPEMLDIDVANLRSNPFVLEQHDAAIAAMVSEILQNGPMRDQFAWVVVARLPRGGFVDVDSSPNCEAVKNAGLARVKATVVGTFTDGDCRRIGIAPQYPPN